MDVAAFVVSIVALLFSGVVLVVETKREYRLAKVNLEFEFFRDIFSDYLIKEIPHARGVMWIDNMGNLKDEQKLVDILNSMRIDSLYFSYKDKSFYNKLKSTLQSLEDFLVESAGKQHDQQDIVSFWKTVEEQLNNIYQTITDAYCGNL